MSKAVVEKGTLSIAGAKAIAAAAVESAIASGLNVVIAVVDDGGHLLYLERMDGAIAGSVEVARRKACGAAMFRTETKNFETGLAGGTLGLLSLDLVAFGGGVPAVVGGGVVGGIGVSGGSAAQDDAIAHAGVDAIASANLIAD